MRRMRAMGGAVVAVALASACTHVGSSGYATGPTLAPSSGYVVVSATRDPASAQELGVVEAHGPRATATIEQIVAEFRARVASMGGDYGRIDAFPTKHDLVTQTYAYGCGTPKAPMTCTGYRQVEVATFSVVGRAFRTLGGGR
jgi:hypothetical protein